MKTLIAFRYSNEDITVLEPMLFSVKKALESKGVESYCTIFSKDRNDSLLKPKDWMQHAFKIIDNCDFLFVVQHSQHKSEGMLMEVGYAIAKNIPIVVAAKNSIKDSYLSDMASYTIRWNNLAVLKSSINNFDFNTFK